MDIFIEKIVKRRKGISDMLMVVGIIVLTFLIIFFLIPYAPGFSLLLVFAIFYLAYLLITMRNIEFEYAVTNGDLDIDKITDQKKRKSVFNANCKDFEVVARIESDKYTNEIKECKNIKDFTSHAKNSEIWFIYMRQEKSPVVVFFEPTTQMIDNFFTFNPSKIFRN